MEERLACLDRRLDRLDADLLKLRIAHAQRTYPSSLLPFGYGVIVGAGLFMWVFTLL